MTWYHVSIIGNIVLAVILAVLALDRRNTNNRIQQTIQQFKTVCELRHNPIDKAIERIEDTLDKIWEAIEKLRER